MARLARGPGGPVHPGHPHRPTMLGTHNGIVEALTALRDPERACVPNNASPTAAVGRFHDRPWGRTHWSLTAAPRTQCSIKEHRPDFVRQWQSDSSD